MYGPIWFVGGCKDNEILTLHWAERFKVRVPLGLPIGVKIVPEPQIEQFYRLEGFTSEGGAIFYCYLFEGLTPAEVYERIDLPPHQPECEFVLSQYELDRRLGILPAQLPSRRLVR
jgi:hypothetical protein